MPLSLIYRFIFLVSFFLSSQILARQGSFKNIVPWAQVETFDFCPDTKGFDFRNAYWLAAISHYSYWEPQYLEQIFTAPLGKALSLPIKNSEDSQVNETIETLGLGWKGHVDFFTSEPLVPHSPKKYNDHYSSYFTAPLPFEACVKKEKQWCFGSATSRKPPSSMELRECGEKLELAFMNRDRLHKVHQLALGLPMEAQELRQARIDTQRIHHFVAAYEAKKGIELGLDFSEPGFAERCDVYTTLDTFTPDVQALWMESSDLVIVAFRGTEQDNIIDWTTDFATSFQLNHKYLPFWKRNVHKGFEQSLEVMSSWLQRKVNQLFNRYPNASKIPIFLTGHSMGGALATLVMTSWMERNQKTSFETRLNLKAVYTFGAPRLGNLNFAQYYEKLNLIEKVGTFRIVKNKDVVTKAPCFDYKHFGTNIQLTSPDPAPAPVFQLSVLVNPPSDDYNYCAYGSEIFDSLYNIKGYVNDHNLAEYFRVLFKARQELHRSLSREEGRYLIRALQRGETVPKENNPFRYPLNCKKIPITESLAPDYLKVNFQETPFEIER